MRVRREIISFIVVIQSVLFLTHYLLYETWAFAPAGSATPGAFWIKLALGFLSVSFIAASLLAFRYTNAALRAFYRAAAVWMGLVSFLFLAAVSAWIIFGVARLAGLNINFHRTVEWLFGAATRPDSTGFSTQAGRGSREPRCGLRTCRKRGAGAERR